MPMTFAARPSILSSSGSSSVAALDFNFELQLWRECHSNRVRRSVS